MYQRNFIWLIVLLFLQVISSCKLSQEEDFNNSEEIDMLTENYHATFYQFEIFGDGLNEKFQIENRGLNGIYLHTDSDESNPAFSRYLLCYDNLRLDLLKNLGFPSFFYCYYNDSLIYLGELNVLADNIELKRIKIVDDLEVGIIEESKAIELLDELKNDFKDSIVVIKNKYDSKFKTCLKNGFVNSREYLGKQKWSEFRACLNGFFI
jgi:hypothetical protein